MPKRLRLTRRDLDVLNDAARFGLVVPELIRPYRFAGKSPAAVTSTLRRLYGQPPRYLYLRPEPLDDHRVYYRLTGRGVRVIGAARRATNRLGRQSLPRRYALQWLIACHRPHARTLLDREALDRLLGNPRGMTRQGFYTEQAEATRLGLAIVDHGAEPKRLVRKAASQAERLLENAATREFFLAGRFTLAVLTFDEAKRIQVDRLVRTRLAKQLRMPLFRLGVRGPSPLAVESYTVPGLSPLVLGRLL